MALALVGMANLLFVAVMLVSLPDPGVIADRIKAAFVAGELGQEDYLPYEVGRAVEQYADCVVLQMISNPDPQPLDRALAPVIYKTDQEFTSACPVLRAVVYGALDRDDLLSFRYSRYWHGYNAVAGFALPLMELQDLRRLLSASVWTAIATLALLSIRSSRRVRWVGLTIALSAATLWAVPYFDHGLTYGSSDPVLLLGLLPIVVRRRLGAHLTSVIPYAATYGACMVFLDMNKGAIPVAAGWFTALVLAAASDHAGGANRRIRAISLGALFAFAMGAGVTLALKQILAFALANSDAGAQFVSQAEHWMAIPAAKDGWPGILVPFRSLFEASGHLTYGHDPAGRSLVGATLLAWIVGAIWALRHWHTQRGREVQVFLFIALIPVAWTLLQPTAVAVHAGLMVRFLIVSISVAPIILLWPKSTQRRLSIIVLRARRYWTSLRSKPAET